MIGAGAAAVPRSRYVLFFALAVGGCLADLSTKRLLFDRLGMPGGETLWVVDRLLGFRTSLNEGALFGIGQGLVFFFAVLSVLAAVAIGYWLFVAGEARSRWMTVALGCVSGGIFGNLYDRLGLHGLVWHLPPREGLRVYAVRDWIHFTVGRFEWPTFNLADSLLVCGVAMLTWHALRAGPSAADDR